MPSVLRVCPASEEDAASKDCVEVACDGNTLKLSRGAAQAATARAGEYASQRFDFCFDSGASDEDVVAAVAPGLVRRLVARETVTVVTHGQPGSGKSRTAHALITGIARLLKDPVADAYEAWDDERQGLGPSPTKADPPPDPEPQQPSRNSLSGDPFSFSPQRGAPIANRRLSAVQDRRGSRPGSAQHRKSLGAGGGSGRSPSASPRPDARGPRPSVVVVQSTGEKKAREPQRVSVAAGSRGSLRDAPAEQTRPGSPSRRTSAARASIRASSPGLTALRRGNGRRGDCAAMLFDGTSSFVRLPALPSLDRGMSRGFAVDFWIKVDPGCERPQTVLKIKDKQRGAPCVSITLNWDIEHANTPGTVMFHASDLDQKTVEAQVTPEIFDGEWHHMEWAVNNLHEHKVSCFIDGEEPHPKFGSCDAPGNFSHWLQLGCVGGDLMQDEQASGEAPPGEIDQGFRGMLAEFYVWGPDEDDTGGLVPSRSMLAYWTLDAVQPEEGDDDTLVCKDVTGSGFDASARHVSFAPTVFPDTAVSFDGKSSYVNVGQLGEFGEHLNGFVIEFWVRTTETKQMMSLMGMRDTSHRHPGFGIEFNTTAFGKLSSGLICFWTRDCSGDQYFPVTVQAQGVFDGDWHHVRWQVTDAYRKKIKVNIDKQSQQDLDFPAPEGTHQPQFAAFTQWVCIGAHNDRGTVKGHFKGSLRNVKFWSGREEGLVAHWALDEGACAKIAMDKTGCGHNGVFFTGKRKLSRWVHGGKVDKCTPAADVVAGLMGVPVPEVSGLRHRNNRLRLSCVAFGADPDDAGTFREVQYDVVHGDFVGALGQAPHYPENCRRFPMECRGECYPVVAEQCWEGESIKPDKYMQLIKDILSRLQEEDIAKCNTVFSFWIGDGSLTVFDMLGYQRSRRANAFDAVHLIWSDTVATMTADGKRKVVMNKALQAAQVGLLELGCYPQLVKRNIALSKKLQNKVRGAFDGADVARLLLGSLLRGQPHGTLYTLSTITQRPTVDELVSINAVAARLRTRSEYWAAVMMQKAFRATIAKMAVRVLSSGRDAARCRESVAREMRGAHPKETEPKSKRFAVLVGVGGYEKAALPDHPTAAADCKVLERVLQGLGFEVVRFHTGGNADGMPTHAAVLKAVARARRMAEAGDTLSLVYIACHGVDGFLHRPPELAQAQEWLSEWEQQQRGRVEQGEESAREEIARDSRSERTEALGEQQRREEEEAKREARRKSNRRQSASPQPRASRRSVSGSPTPGPEDSPGGARRPSAAPRPVSPNPAAAKRGSVSSPGGGRKQSQAPSPKGKPGAKRSAPAVSVVDPGAGASPPAGAEAPTEAAQAGGSAPEQPLPELPRPRSPPRRCRYLLPYDVGTEFSEAAVWPVDELIEAAVGGDVQLGCQSLLILDAAAPGVAPGGDRESGGFGCVAASTQQTFHVEYGAGQGALLSYYAIRGILGSATSMAIKPADGKPQLFDSVGLEQLLAYLRSKMGPAAAAQPARRLSAQHAVLMAAQPRWPDLRRVWGSPHGEYVGEFVLAAKPQSKRDRQVAKTRARGKRHRASCVLRIDLGCPGAAPCAADLSERIAKHLAALALNGDPVEVRSRTHSPWLCCDFADGDWNTATRKEMLAPEWQAGFARLQQGYTGPVRATPRHEPCELHVRWLLDTSEAEGPPQEKETALQERDRGARASAAVAAWQEHVRGQWAAWKEGALEGAVIAGFALTGMHCEVTASITVPGLDTLQRLDRAARLSLAQQQRSRAASPVAEKLPALDPSMQLVSLWVLTEQEGKLQERQEMEIAAEEKKEAEVQRALRLKELEERRKEEEIQRQVDQKRAAVNEQITQLNNPGILGKMDQKQLRFIFCFEAEAQWAAALECVLLHVSKSPAAASFTAGLGCLEYAKQGLTRFGDCHAVVRPACAVLQTVGETYRPVKKPKPRPEDEDGPPPPEPAPELMAREAWPAEVLAAVAQLAGRMLAAGDSEAAETAECALSAAASALAAEADIAAAAAGSGAAGALAGAWQAAASAGELRRHRVVRGLLRCAATLLSTTPLAQECAEGGALRGAMRLGLRAARGEWAEPCEQQDGADAERALRALGLRVCTAAAACGSEAVAGVVASEVADVCAVATEQLQRDGKDVVIANRAVACLEAMLRGCAEAATPALQQRAGLLPAVCGAQRLLRLSGDDRPPDLGEPLDALWAALRVANAATSHMEAGQVPGDVRVVIALMAGDCRQAFASDQDRLAVAAALAERATAS